MKYKCYYNNSRSNHNTALPNHFLKFSDQTNCRFSRYHGRELKKCRFEKIAIKVTFSKTFAGSSIKTDAKK